MRALFPASFDPVTNGHMDIVTRAARCFESVIVGAFDDHNSATLFTVEERVEMLRIAAAHLTNVTVQPYAGLTVDFAREIDAGVLVRGLRAVSDFEHEFAFSSMNRRLYPEIDTVFFLSAPEHTYVSSTLVREIGALGRSVEEFVPTNVAAAVGAKFGHATSRG